MDYRREQTREENYQEYLRLKENPEYNEVVFDGKSGGVSAVHRLHRFDKQIGPFGYKRGEYEHHVVTILRQNGHRVILLSEDDYETSLKRCDGLLDGVMMEIKTIEGDGHWSVRTKIYDASRQGADLLVLFFPKSNFFSVSRIEEGWKMCEDASDSILNWKPIIRILAIVENRIIEIPKPPG